MAGFSIRFLGCKVSYADAQAIRERLLADGHTEATGGAEVAVVNTCCVTHEAVRKSRHAAARAARTHGKVYVTGCGASLEADGFDGLPDNVVVVARRSEETPGFVAGDVGAVGCVQADARLERVRAFVKVQDGCSFSCAFCVIPSVRGASRSRRAEAVLREARRRVEQGHKEIVLTGINLGCYRDREAGYTLARLVREVGEIPGLARLRLSSIEVNHVNGELVDALRETPVLARHLHVPLQSGEDGVLRAMGRRYDSATYLRRVEPLADFNLTSDVIVGFPGEDEQALSRGPWRSSTGPGSRASTCSRTRRGPVRRPQLPTPSRPHVKRSAASACVSTRGLRASSAGARRSGARTSYSSTARAAGTATTTRPGWCEARSASSSASGRAA